MGLLTNAKLNFSSSPLFDLNIKRRLHCTYRNTVHEYTITWLHTRSKCTGTYFECEGVCTYFKFTLTNFNLTFVYKRSQSAPPSVDHTTLQEPTESDVERCYNFDEQTDKQVPWIQLKPSLFTSFDTKCSSANYKPAVVSSFSQVISLYSLKTLH